MSEDQKQTTAIEFTLRIRLDQPISDKARSDELALHISPLIARHCICGDVVFDSGAEDDWALEVRD